MSELIITPVPGRTGYYLCLQHEGGVESLARFGSHEKMEKFIDWLQEHEGRTLFYKDDNEQGC